MSTRPTTSIARSAPDDIIVRGRSLCNELIGARSFTEMMCFVVLGRVPPPPQVAVIDACMVALMEHGLTPSALSTRLVYTSTPEAMQSAVAAGLLAVGDRFVGTVQGCGRLLERVSRADDPRSEAAAVVAELCEGRQPIPGFGHPIHKPDDPRTPALLAVARREGVAGAFVDALQTLSYAVDAALARHLTVNATGAVAALLGDCGVPADIMRGFILVSRCAGLVAHIHEERDDPAMNEIWAAAERAVPYREDESP